MFALISPLEKIEDYEGNTGERVAQVEPQPFDVAEPLFWVECPDDCVADSWWFYFGQCQPIPQPPKE